MKTMRIKRKICTYNELVEVATGENDEQLIDVRNYDNRIIAHYEKMDMLPYTGEFIFVRDTVARKLATANAALIKRDNLFLKIVYGYRHPDIQKMYFDKMRAKLKMIHLSLNDKELDALTHNFVAVPLVAGHPTGGAIDITIVDTEGNVLDMGTDIADFSNPEKIKTFANGLSSAQKKNRLLLRDVLMNEDFAPFYGEWWHFSYGDREWACFYEKPASLYSPANFKIA